MPLAMSRPWKHPKTGIYWLRKRVPDELVKLVGKREEPRTIETRDPAVAKVKHAAALADVEARWANLRAGPKVLSEREAFELAAPLGDWWISQYRDNPSGQTVWHTAYGVRVFAPAPILDGDSLNTLFTVKKGDLEIAQMERWCKDAAAAMSTSRGLQLDKASTQLVATVIARVP